MQGQRSNKFQQSTRYRCMVIKWWVGLGGKQGKQSSLNCYVNNASAHMYLNDHSLIFFFFFIHLSTQYCEHFTDI